MNSQNPQNAWPYNQNRSAIVANMLAAADSNKARGTGESTAGPNGRHTDTHRDRQILPRRIPDWDQRGWVYR